MIEAARPQGQLSTTWPPSHVRSQVRAAREAEAAAVQALAPQLAALEAQWEVLHAVSGAADAEELLAIWQGARAVAGFKPGLLLTAAVGVPASA